MIKDHRYKALTTMLLFTLMVSAGPMERINAIKRDSMYIYGEATKPAAAKAYDAALDILQYNIQQWYDENNSKKRITKTLRDLTFLADTIHAMRGDFHRVFAYIPISKLEETILSDAEMEATARKGAHIPAKISNAPLHPEPRIDEMLRTLIEKRNYQDFASLILQDKENGSISTASRDITLQQEDSYLAIFNKNKKSYNLLYLLAPGHGFRKDLITGQQIDQELFFQNRDTFRFLWFVPSDSK